MRTLLLLCLGIAAGGLGAYEATTLIPSSDHTSSRMITLNAKSGLARVYRVRAAMNGLDALELKHSTFVIEDYRNLVMIKDYGANLLHILGDRSAPEEVPHRRIMLGRNNRRNWVHFFGLVKGASPLFSQEVVDEVTGDSPLTLAYKAEMDFWSEPPAYDGHMVGAMSGESALFYVPATNVMLLYWLKNDQLQLRAYRNIRPELMISVPDGFGDFNSYPLFNDVKRAIRDREGGATLLAVRTAGIEQAVESMETDANVMSPAESDPFLGSLTNRRYVLADMANNRIMVYHYSGENRGLELLSLRNTELDRMLPIYPLPRRRLNAMERAKVNQYMRDLGRGQRAEIDRFTEAMQGWIREQGFKHYRPDDLDIQVELFTQYARQVDERFEAEGGEEQDWDARIMQSEDSRRLVIDLKRERRLYVYDPVGNQGKIELLTVQSYAIDTALAAYTEKLKDIPIMRGLYERTLRYLTRASAAAYVLRQFEFLLQKAPQYHQQITDERRTKRWLKYLEEWDEDNETQLVAKYQEMMQQAQENAEAQRAQLQAWIEATQAVLTQREEALAAAAERRGR